MASDAFWKCCPKTDGCDAETNRFDSVSYFLFLVYGPDSVGEFIRSVASRQGDGAETYSIVRMEPSPSPSSSLSPSTPLSPPSLKASMGGEGEGEEERADPSTGVTEVLRVLPLNSYLLDCFSESDRYSLIVRRHGVPLYLLFASSSSSSVASSTSAAPSGN